MLSKPTKESDFEWGVGKKKQETVHVDDDSRTFTIGIDDPMRDAKLKNATRWGDPMAGMISGGDGGGSGGKKKKKKHKEERVLEYTGPGGFPNRFGIKPGAAWDGRDRSNGWEAKCFKHQNAQKVKAQDRFAYSVGDL